MTTKPQADYGPSLPELLRPRLRALGRWPRIAIGIVVLLVLVAIAATVIHVEAQKRSYTQTARDARARGLPPIPFHFDHARKLRIFKPPGDYVQAEWKVKGTLAASFSVSPFKIKGQSRAALRVHADSGDGSRAEGRARVRPLRLQFEGRARVNDAEGYRLRSRLG